MAQSPEAASRIENARMFHISVGLRPNRSASLPNTKAPMGRAANVKNVASTTSFTSTWKVVAMSLNMNIMRKKSKASRVQPR